MLFVLGTYMVSRAWAEGFSALAVRFESALAVRFESVHRDAMITQAGSRMRERERRTGTSALAELLPDRAGERRNAMKEMQ